MERREGWLEGQVWGLDKNHWLEQDELVTRFQERSKVMSSIASHFRGSILEMPFKILTMDVNKN